MRQLPWREELVSERGVLAKAEQDIEQGWLRLRRQQQTVARIRDHGRQSRASDDLLVITAQVLIEWEKHRSLIAQRIAYLEQRLLEADRSHRPSGLRAR